MMKFRNAYDFQRAIYKNTWSPLLMFLRKIELYRGFSIKIEEVDSPTLRGFEKSIISKEKNVIIEGDFYTNDLSEGSTISIAAKKENYDDDKKEIYELLSSFEFSKEQRTANEFYRQGLAKLIANKTIDAQFDFANAYAISPEPEYGFQLAKALFIVDEKSAESCKELLEEVLKVKPVYKEAQELLETIKQFELKEKPEKKKIAEAEKN